MADKEVDGLPSATALDGSELLHVVQGGNSRQTTLTDIVGISHSQPWSSVTGTPTTLSGYGITDAQPKDDGLTSIAAISPTSKAVMIGNGTAWTSESGSTLRASLGVSIGSDVQAYDASLSALAGLSLASGDIIYATGASTFATLNTGSDGQVLKLAAGAPTWTDASGLGDMLASTYDPTGKAADAFDMSNMAEAADAKVMTAAERTRIAGAVMNTDTATTDMQFVGAGSDLSIDPAKLLKRGDAADAIDARVPAPATANIGKTFYVKRDLSGYEFVRPVMVDLVQTYGIDPDDNVTDQSTTLNNALADLAGKGVIAFIRPIDQTYDANVGIGSTIIIPSGVILQGAGGYGGDNQGFDDFAGVRFTWVGANDGKMVWFDGVHHAGLRGVRMEANGRTGMIGAHFSSDGNPGSSYTHMKHFSMLGFHKALVFGDPADAYDSGSLPGSIMQAQADSIDISDFTIFGGNAADTGIHINGRNVLQSSVIRQGNIQACNIAVHIHNTNGDFTLQHLVVGNAATTGADKTAFRFESTLLVPPKLDSCETEGTMDYAVHDSSTNAAYQYPSVWTQNYFNNSILIDGNARIASIGNSGGSDAAGKTWVVGGTAKVISMFDATNLPASKISPWTTTGSGKVMELGDRNDIMELAGVEKLPTVSRQAPTYVNSWVDVGGTERPGGYYKDLEGIVYLEGAVTGGTAVQIFTLPVGYRPTKNVRFAVAANSAFGIVTVDTNGGVYLTTGTKTNVYLDGVSFRAA